MNARRIPFQFSTTDPLARQRELEKRFGLQRTCPKMYVDVNNPLSMGTTSKETSSPRLQHRVPIFAEGYDQPIHSSSVDSMASVPDNKKPNVRVIPIEIEGADSRSQRHRTFSGPADTVKDRCDNIPLNRNEAYPINRFNFEGLSRPSKPKHEEPRIFNIPIQIEGVNNSSRSPKVDVAQKPKNILSTANACSQPKLPSKAKSFKKDDEMQAELNKNETDHCNINIDVLLKKIEDVLTEFKKYETEIVEFSGTSKDKQYRYLDEMLTRCMLRLDDIDTMGNEKIRLARKNAVKKIQASIDLLESKANVKPVASTEVSQVQSISNKDSPIEMNDNTVDMQDNQVKDNSEMTEMDLTANDKIHSEVADEISNDTEIQGKSKEESNEATSLQKTTNNVAEMEMSVETTNSCELPKMDVGFEDKTNLSKVTNEAAHENYAEESSSLQEQQNSVPEIETSEQIALISTNNTQPPEMLRSVNDNIEQNEDFIKLTNDVEMMDENATSNAVEVTEGSLSLDETADKKGNMSNDVPDVEMDEISNISPKETDNKIESETAVDGIIPNPACSGNTNHNPVDLNVQVLSPINTKDAEMKDIDATQSTSGDEVTCNLSEQDASHPEKHDYEH